MQGQQEIMQFLRDSLGLGQNAAVRLTPVVKGGSDRAFYRAACHQGSFMFMWYDPARTENNYYVSILKFLSEIGLRVPNLIGYDPELHFVIMEDLGEEDLWSYREAAWPKRKQLYEATLSEILKLHSFKIASFQEKNITLMPAFDTALYRWEQDYFKDHFVSRVCGIDLGQAEAGALALELSRLGSELAQGEPCLVHRDLQSQNVMVREGWPAIIDFQGMRIGNALYDLGSLLYDPYSGLKEGERMELLRIYHGRTGVSLPFARFEALFRKAASQRLMQALGAFGFLGVVRGMKSFLDHIPQGVGNLVDASRRAGCLPVLNGLAARCSEAVRRNLHI